MAKINVLPKEVAVLIAAGEVVERPMSVVKELIENSIDAGADTVTVEIAGGGIRYIRITDNGCGIAREDVPTAFISHATSKIKDSGDLNSIFTLGFRGEALPSIAAVSRLTLLTRTADEETGTNFCIEGGETVSVEDAGCPVGTTVIVRDLFFNTPARMKFLRRDVTEGTYVSDAVTKVALSHPEIKFSLIRDGKKVLATPGNGDLYSAVFAIFGKDTAQALLKCDYADSQTEIHGYISKPLSNRPNRNMQYFFVNGRCVRVPAAVPALDEAYKNSIMVGKFPMCFLSIKIPLEKTDVNVHPAKTEIRFAEDSKLFEAVYSAARNAIAQGDKGRPVVNLTEKRDITAANTEKPSQLSMEKVMTAGWGEKLTEKADRENRQNYGSVSGSAVTNGEENKKSTAVVSEQIVVGQSQSVSHVLKDSSADKFNKTAGEVDSRATGYTVPWKTESKKVNIDISVDDEKPDEKTEEKPFKPVAPVAVPEIPKCKTEKEKPEESLSFRIVGEVFKTYILVECNEKMLIIDKHAAHERVIFNSITENVRSGGSQLLLVPVSVTLAPKEYAAVIENIEIFERAGFGTEDFGSGTVLIRSCPVELSNQDISAIVIEIAGKLLKGSMRPVPEKLDWLYHSAACRAAVKAGDDLKPQEAEHLVKILLTNDSIRYCPHGRPVMYELSKYEIEKQFGRLG